MADIVNKELRRCFIQLSEAKKIFIADAENIFERTQQRRETHQY